MNEMVLQSVRISRESMEYLKSQCEKRGDYAHHIRIAIDEYVEKLKGE